MAGIATPANGLGSSGSSLILPASCWRTQITVEANRDLIRSGPLAGRVGLFVSGTGLRQRFGSDGNRQALDIYLRGDIAGLESVLLGPNSTEVRTCTPVVLAVTDGAAFKRSLAQPGMAETVLITLAAQRRRIENRLARLGLLPAQGRIAALLVDVLGRLGTKGDQGVNLCLKQRDVAALTGLTAIHVSRVLHHLTRSSVLTFQRGTVTVHDWDTLYRMACRDGAVEASVLGL